MLSKSAERGQNFRQIWSNRSNGNHICAVDCQQAVTGTGQSYFSSYVLAGSSACCALRPQDPWSRLNRPTVRNSPGLGTRERGPCGGAGRGVDAQATGEALASKDVLGRPAVEQRVIVCA